MSEGRGAVAEVVQADGRQIGRAAEAAAPGRRTPQSNIASQRRHQLSVLAQLSHRSTAAEHPRSRHDDRLAAPHNSTRSLHDHHPRADLDVRICRDALAAGGYGERSLHDSSSRSVGRRDYLLAQKELDQIAVVHVHPSNRR